MSPATEEEGTLDDGRVAGFNGRHSDTPFCCWTRLERLIISSPMQHEVHDEISLEIGRRVATRLREKPAILQIARDNLARWSRRNADAPALIRSYREWQTILDRPLEDICQILENDS